MNLEKWEGVCAVLVDNGGEYSGMRLLPSIVVIEREVCIAANSGRMMRTGLLAQYGKSSGSAQLVEFGVLRKIRAEDIQAGTIRLHSYGRTAVARRACANVVSRYSAQVQSSACVRRRVCDAERHAICGSTKSSILPEACAAYSITAQQSVRNGARTRLAKK